MNATTSANQSATGAINLAEETALRTGAAVLPKPDAGVLILSDSDRADFLHRMSTNNINALKPGEAAVTVITSSTARNLFVFTVLARADDLLLLPAAGRTEALAKHLRGQIFFMDAVKVKDASADLKRMRVLGPAALQAVATLGLDLHDLRDGAWAEADGILALRQEAYDVPGVELIVPATQVEECVAALVAAGVHRLESAQAYQVRRIELGRPAPGSEINDAYNPLESGLAWACSDNKGCYTGQEIIARQITYDKVTKTLVGLTSAQALPVGGDVTAEGRSVGTVTSAAFSPHLQRHLGLAVIKRPHNSPGAAVDVEGIPATVAALPFDENEQS